MRMRRVLTLLSVNPSEPIHDVLEMAMARSQLRPCKCSYGRHRVALSAVSLYGETMSLSRP